MKCVLNIACGRIDTEQYSFKIHSASMTATVQLLGDESTAVTWRLYCRQDGVVTIHIRKRTDPSSKSSKSRKPLCIFERLSKGLWNETNSL